jgi:hypothetical protein
MDNILIDILYLFLIAVSITIISILCIKRNAIVNDSTINNNSTVEYDDDDDDENTIVLAHSKSSTNIYDLFMMADNNEKYAFCRFLEQQSASESILFYLEVETFKKLFKEDQPIRNHRLAMVIFETFISPLELVDQKEEGIFEPPNNRELLINISSNEVKHIKSNLESGQSQIRITIFDESQNEIKEMLWENFGSQFIQEYSEHPEILLNATPSHSSAIVEKLITNRILFINSTKDSTIQRGRKYRKNSTASLNPVLHSLTRRNSVEFKTISEMANATDSSSGSPRESTKVSSLKRTNSSPEISTNKK